LRQTPSRDLAVAFLDFDTDGFAAELFRGNQRGAAAHEGIENYVSLL